MLVLARVRVSCSCGVSADDEQHWQCDRRDRRLLSLLFSDGEPGQAEVVGQADQSDAVQALCRPDAQGRPTGESNSIYTLQPVVVLSARVPIV